MRGTSFGRYRSVKVLDRIDTGRVRHELRSTILMDGQPLIRAAVVCALLVAALGACSGPSSVSPANTPGSAQQQPSLQDTTCGFRGPNPTLAEARREAQRIKDAYPDAAAFQAVEIDHLFDYYYQQLIPGSVEAYVKLACSKIAGSVPEADRGLMVGMAVYLGTGACKNVETGEIPISESAASDWIEMVRMFCPQFSGSLPPT
ncbi:hypothetical protein [Mycobacterium adipatum]|uniref:hypothetical protein n=1 Tax=Mycobacterium adipatum TaxID=1682113 RepID=UPI0012E7BF00|nr:hypothetical protein [Mycobacterium adipatum]